MNIIYKPPAERGVTTLMYVGDDDAVEKAVGDERDSHVLFGGIALLIALNSKGTTRLAALGVLGYVGYRVYKTLPTLGRK